MPKRTISKGIKVACPHEAKIGDIRVTASDYHPLTKLEIANLLTIASISRDDPFVVSDVQIRLNQGIVGMTCPRPSKGDAAAKLSEMDRLFMSTYKEGSSPDIVEKLHRIMTR